MVIEACWGAGWTIPRIADRVGCSRQSIGRELTAHCSYTHGTKNPLGRHTDNLRGLGGPYRWGYLATAAQARSTAAARRPKRAKLAVGEPARPLVLSGLRRRWSPQQVAASLRVIHPERPELWVSHETIYQAIYVQGRGNLRAELARQVALRSGRTRRRAHPVGEGAVRSRRPWVEGFHISTRPGEVADRAVPGHWEGDLLVGKGGASAIVTLVERSTRYVLLGALPDGRASQAVIAVLAQLAAQLPAHLRRSLTWDQGSELARHAEFTVASSCQVFFCDPHSPWQRGSNENTNGLLRQYFPKGVTDFRRVPQGELDTVAAELNGRPRQTLSWHTPAQALNKHLGATTA